MAPMYNRSGLHELSALARGGTVMNELLKSAANPFLMWGFGAIGDAMLIVGIVAAIREVAFAGFTPVIWFLLAIAFYLGMVWIVTLRILAHVEGQVES